MSALSLVRVKEVMTAKVLTWPLTIVMVVLLMDRDID